MDSIVFFAALALSFQVAQLQTLSSAQQRGGTNVPYSQEFNHEQFNRPIYSNFPGINGDMSGKNFYGIHGNGGAYELNGYPVTYSGSYPTGFDRHNPSILVMLYRNYFLQRLVNLIKSKWLNETNYPVNDFSGQNTQSGRVNGFNGLNAQSALITGFDRLDEQNTHFNGFSGVNGSSGPTSSSINAQNKPIYGFNNGQTVSINDLRGQMNGPMNVFNPQRRNNGPVNSFHAQPEPISGFNELNWLNGPITGPNVQNGYHEPTTGFNGLRVQN